MEKNLLDNYKKLLKEEEAVLQDELKKIAVKVNDKDWVATDGVDNDGEEYTDKGESERQNDINNLITNQSIVNQLEVRLNNVLKALKKIEDGTFGVCEVSGKKIEKERLDANPAARTNIENIDAILEP